MIAKSSPQQFYISDILEWHRAKTLRLNPDFQRRSVWTPAAKVFLIDTILRQLPIPKVYIRTKVDPESQMSYREVVDGQQRLRAIIDFASDKLTLSIRAKEFSGLRYSELDQENKENFLAYSIGIDQLINASDDDVLEVFSRLNSYTLPLNPAERRHAQYQGDFKWAVREASQRWAVLWEKYRIVSVRNRLRMQDDSLMSEIFGVVLQGMTDGGQKKIDRIYSKYDRDFPQVCQTVEKVNKAISFIVDKLDDVLIESTISRSTHFLMLFAAVAHSLYGIPSGEMGDDMPQRDEKALTDLDISRYNLELISNIIDSEDSYPQRIGFWRASRGTTQRIASRRERFPVFCEALLPGPMY